MTSSTDKLFPQSRVVVDLSKLAHNIRQLKSRSQARLFMAVVKADAYGHGAVETARLALKAGADRLAVVRISEARELIDTGINAPILLFGEITPDHLAFVAEHDIRITLVSLDDARLLSALAVKKGACLTAHIKVDTGMGRLGFYSQPEEIQEKGCSDMNAVANEILEIKKLPGIAIEGLYTHFANADTKDLTHAEQQLDNFKALIRLLKKNGLVPQIIHAANSAATIGIPQAHFDMVRPGISLYGLMPSQEMDSQSIDLQPVMTITSRIIQIKDVPAGFRVSYGSTYVTPAPTRIATIPIGYADGYNRLLSSKGSMLVRGRRAPVRGRVCMDFTMIDVGHIESAAPGDEVVIMGCQEDECITADEIASLTHTINYEVVAALTRRMPITYIYPKG